MRQKLSLKNENRGASLLVVLVILVVVSAIAVIITKITITNIQMKEVERGSKKNFYSAEEILDDLHTGAAGVSAEAMQSAYESVMQNYVKTQKAGVNLQDEFKKFYLQAMELKFWDSTSCIKYKRADKDKTTVNQTKPDGDGKEGLTIVPESDAVYSTSMYSLDTLKSCISVASARTCVETSAADAVYDADYKNGIFTLKNVKIVFNGSSDYETTITTDLVFNTPEMNLTGGDQVKEFMKYSLIADTAIEVSNSKNVNVGGNVYAGQSGITTKNTSIGDFHGKVVLTRGDIVAENDSKLTIGNGHTSVWAENIVANGTPKGFETATSEDADKMYTLAINGNCYVADDLSLQKANSRVKISGNYYGYNFQKNYATLDPSNDAQFSSAMLINGKKSKLDLSNLNYLMLAGRTFISRGSEKNADGSNKNNDVMLGESISVRTNQLAYYVPDTYLDTANFKFTADGIKKYETDTGIEKFDEYLDTTKQVVAYHYVDVVSGNQTNYYLNFKNEQKANDFFAKYCAGKQGSRNSQYASKYLTNDAIVLDDAHVFTLKGDIMYRNAADTDLKEEKVVIDSNQWTTGGTYFDYCADLAVKYKALELGLTETNALAEKSDVRLHAEGKDEIDKSVNPLFLTLIDKASLENDVTSETDALAKENIDEEHYRAAYLVNNNAESDNAFEIPDKCTQGIIVATGDVKVNHDFTGLIISGGKIFFGNDAKIDADESMVVDMFAKDLKKDKPLFSKYFNDYKSGDVITGTLNGKIDANNYLTYENWKKNS